MHSHDEAQQPPVQHGHILDGVHVQKQLHRQQHMKAEAVELAVKIVAHRPARRRPQPSAIISSNGIMARPAYKKISSMVFSSVFAESDR